MGSRGPRPDPTKPYSRHKGREIADAPPLPSAPKRPLRPVPEGTWMASAKRWWRQMAGSSQARRWMPTDWMLLEQGLVLVDRYHRIRIHGAKWGTVRDMKSLATEIRQLHRELGASPQARATMGWGNPVQDVAAFEGAEGEDLEEPGDEPAQGDGPDPGEEGGFLRMVQGGA